MALSQLFWDVLMPWNLKSTYFSLKMIHFLSLKHLICHLCCILNKILKFETSTSLHSVFIHNLYSVPTFLESGLYIFLVLKQKRTRQNTKQKCFVFFCFVLQWVNKKLKGIVHLEIKIWCLSAYPQGIQDVGDFVFFSRTQTKIFNSNRCSLSVI